MIFNSQTESINELNRLYLSNRQGVLIEGRQGCGKTFLSQQYANMFGISDFIVVSPKVSEIRDALDTSAQLQTRVMLDIENLDTGVSAAAYTLLKSLEEPLPNVYIVITTRNIKQIPDTILSRSAVVTVGVPTYKDLDEYSQYVDSSKYHLIKDRLAYRCARSFSDVNDVFSMNADQLSYYESLSQVCQLNDNISSLIWAVSHYSDNQPCNVELAIRCIMELMNNPFVTRCGVQCTRDLASNRVAQHAVLAKFLFDIKYCE